MQAARWAVLGRLFAGCRFGVVRGLLDDARVHLGLVHLEVIGGSLVTEAAPDTGVPIDDELGPRFFFYHNNSGRQCHAG